MPSSSDLGAAGLLLYSMPDPSPPRRISPLITSTPTSSSSSRGIHPLLASRMDLGVARARRRPLSKFVRYLPVGKREGAAACGLAAARLDAGSAHCSPPRGPPPRLHADLGAAGAGGRLLTRSSRCLPVGRGRGRGRSTAACEGRVAYGGEGGMRGRRRGYGERMNLEEKP